jgi:hypothetical protein
MPPAPATRLLPEEVAILETWTTAGGPRSDDTCSDEPAPPLGQPKQECQPDIRIRPSTPHVIAAEGPMDQYVCYGFDVANTEKKHIVSMAPVVENLKVVHHAQLFETDVPYPSAPTPCDSGESSKWRLVTGWAPGGKAHVFPQEAGWPQAVGTTHYVVQLHYSNPQKLNNEKDNTGFDLCSTTKLRPNDAGMLAFGVMDSFGSILRIPARALKYKMECSYKLPDQFPEIKFISMTPHLHSLGRASSASIQPLGQTNRTSLLDVKDFSFDSQLAYPLTGSAKAGDAIMTSCVWANPRDLTVTWGHNADSEMCYSYLTYYPRMPDIPSTFGFGGFNWLTPAANGECVNVAP